MVKLLMRFYDVNSGSISVDGHNIKDFKRSELRKMFGIFLAIIAIHEIYTIYKEHKKTKKG